MPPVSYLLVLSLLLGCAPLRMNHEFRGPSSFKTPADHNVGSEYAAEPLELPPPRTYRPQQGFRLQWPVAPVKLNRGFQPLGRPRHLGLDLGGKRGTPIVAAHEGIVIYAGRDFRGYGNLVLLEYNKQWATLYGHLDRIAVQPGQVLQAGQPLGTMGKTGRATGVHLHFEVMRDRLPIDPLKDGLLEWSSPRTRIHSSKR